MNFQKQPLAPGLHFVGVPIGRARDITLHALDVLASAEVLAAEDTRSLRKLMDIHGVPLDGRSLVAFHDHSGPKACEKLLEKARSGAVAYASEAGMPLISDPGFELARGAAERGIAVTCAPGPSAVLTALAISGLATDAFLFAGFLPNTKAARRKSLEQLKEIPATLVFYESPKRVAEMLSDAADVLGASRACALCRELTKKFEETRRGTLEEVARIARETPPRGEIVVLVERGHLQKISEAELRKDLQDALRGHSVRDAVDMVMQAHDLPRRQVYQMALALNNDEA